MDKKIKPYRCLPSKPPGPKFQSCTKFYIASSAFGFDFFVHRPQARSPQATLKFGDVGATTIQQRFDFIVHLRYDTYIYIYIYTYNYASLCRSTCTYMYLHVYMYMYICIRRPRQTQGGARQGIRHLKTFGPLLLLLLLRLLLLLLLLLLLCRQQQGAAGSRQPYQNIGKRLDYF